MNVDNKPSLRNPLKLILTTTIIIFVILLIIYVAARLLLVYDNNNEHQRDELIKTIAEDIRVIAIFAFDFVRPFLQLVIILIILEWLLNRFGISLNPNALKFDWNVQTVIGIVIILAFALAALSGVPGASMLKDVALVVVGFYFGSQKKLTETTGEADSRSDNEPS